MNKMDNNKRCINCDGELILVDEKTLYDEGIRGYDGMVYSYECKNCNCFIQVFIYDNED